MKDGRSPSGLLAEETATTLTLLQSGGVRHEIPRHDLDELRASSFSMMPEGLELGLDAQDLADLISYLRMGPVPRLGSGSAQEHADAKRRFLAAGANGLERVVTSTETHPHASWMGAVVLRCGRQTDGTSEVTWHTDPVPTTLSAGDRHRFRLPAAMGWRSQPEGRFTLLLNGEAALEFPLSIVDASWQNRDASVRMTWTVLQSNSEDGVGVLVLDVAESHLTPGRPMELTVRGSRAGSQRWFGVLENRE